MAYSFFRFLLRIAVHVYYKKVYIQSLNTVPHKTPLILISNHGNSFMDAILIAVILKRKIHFLARADVFNSSWKRWFLEKINMMPIYRIRDGREGIKNNESVFTKCNEILEANGAILMFPEGNCVVEKRLRVFKSGFADIALAVEHPDLAIIPVAINYDNSSKIFGKVCLDFSGNMTLNSYCQQFKERKVLKSELLKDTYQSIKSRMIVIEKEENDAFYQTIFDFKNAGNDEDFVKLDMKLSSILDENHLKQPNQHQTLKSDTIEYQKLLHEHDGREEFVNKELTLSDYLVLIATAVFWISGLLINLIPIKVTAFIVNGIKDQQFKSSVRLVAGCFLFLIYHSILLLGCLFWGKTIFYSIILISSINYYLLYHNVGRLIFRFKTKAYFKIKQQRAKLLAAVNLLLLPKKAS